MDFSGLPIWSGFWPIIVAGMIGGAAVTAAVIGLLWLLFA